MSLPAGTQIGKYVLQRKLAEGGMAEIYLASFLGPEGFRKEVVIKRIRPVLAGDDAFVQMFIAEARLASRLSHANLVQIFDFDKHEDTFYLAMEYVRGQSLWAVRKRAKEWMRPMSPLLVAQVGLEVARGLHYAHRLTDRGVPLNLVHRDVTPHNILISYEGAVKLTDFGIAKAGNRLTSSGMLKGKFAYMSPEQARAEPVDARTDVFALGIVLWELLTGGRLFEDESDVAVLRAVQDRAIPPPARLNPEVPPALDAAVMRALERDLALRWATAQDLERALAQALLGASRSVEDTDVGGYVRHIFPDESAPSEDRPILPAAGWVSRSTPAGSSSPPLSPDEDPHHQTLVLPPAPGVSAPAPAPVPAPRRGRWGLWLAGLAGVGIAAGLVGVPRMLAGRSSALPPVLPAPVPAAVAPGDPNPAVRSAAPELEAPEEARSETETQADPRPPGGAGTLVLRVKPWGRVFLNGSKSGVEVEGTREFSLPAGAHTIRVRHQQEEKVFRVRIRAGKSFDQPVSFPLGR